MNKKINIRNEKETDYQRVEDITRKAFYNLYIPGCTEHYLVHIMRKHEDFIPELDFVIEVDDQVVGNIMYTKAKIMSDKGEEKEILTFGPLTIMPEYQRMGYGKILMEHSFKEAVKLGYDLVVILGSPSNYVSSGFKSCERYHICVEGGVYPSAMMVKELKPFLVDDKKWTYFDSPVMQFDMEKAQEYDDTLEKMEKKYQTSQEEFYILSQSTINEAI